MHPKSTKRKKKENGKLSGRPGNQDGVHGNQNNGDSLTSSSASHENDVDEEPWECSTCTKFMSDDKDVAMECSLCTKYFCGHCINMDDDEYAAVQCLSRDDVLWLCPGCHVKTMNLKICDPNNVSKKVDILEQKFDAIVNTVNESLGQLRVELEKTKDTLVNNVEKSVESSCQKTFKEAFLGQNNDDKLTSAVVENKGVAGMMKEIITEQRQIQDKEEQMRELGQTKNIIIYKKAEKLCKDAEERKKSDREFVDKLLKQMNRADLEIKSVFRLGRFSEDKHKEGKSRPIKLVLYKSDDRDSIMRNTYLLGEGECSDPELRGIHLGYDLSEQERNDIKVKIDEAN